MDTRIDRYAVIGNPVEHSKSPQLHAAFARACRQDGMSFERILCPLDGFAETVAAFRRAGGLGMSVTVPFKVEALALADRLTGRARAAQAINVLCFSGHGIVGDNTDGTGLVLDLERNLHAPVRGKRVLLLGAQGAARGALLPLLEKEPASLFIANRTASRARALRDAMAGHPEVEAGGFSDVAGRTFDIVINATSASLAAEALPLPPGIYGEDALAYDMCYGKGITPFLAEALRSRTRVADGFGMLVEQAVEAFHLWRGVRPDMSGLIDSLRAELGVEKIAGTLPPSDGAQDGRG